MSAAAFIFIVFVGLANAMKEKIMRIFTNEIEENGGYVELKWITQQRNQSQSEKKSSVQMITRFKDRPEEDKNEVWGRKGVSHKLVREYTLDFSNMTENPIETIIIRECISSENREDVEKFVVVAKEQNRIEKEPSKTDEEDCVIFKKQNTNEFSSLDQETLSTLTIESEEKEKEFDDSSKPKDYSPTPPNQKYMYIGLKIHPFVYNYERLHFDRLKKDLDDRTQNENGLTGKNEVLDNEFEEHSIDWEETFDQSENTQSTGFSELTAEFSFFGDKSDLIQNEEGFTEKDKMFDTDLEQQSIILEKAENPKYLSIETSEENAQAENIQNSEMLEIKSNLSVDDITDKVELKNQETEKRKDEKLPTNKKTNKKKRKPKGKPDRDVEILFDFDEWSLNTLSREELIGMFNDLKEKLKDKLPYEMLVARSIKQDSSDHMIKQLLLHLKNINPENTRKKYQPSFDANAKYLEKFIKNIQIFKDHSSGWFLAKLSVSDKGWLQLRTSLEYEQTINFDKKIPVMVKISKIDEEFLPLKQEFLLQAMNRQPHGSLCLYFITKDEKYHLRFYYPERTGWKYYPLKRKDRPEKISVRRGNQELLDLDMENVQVIYLETDVVVNEIRKKVEFYSK